jgi:hypothetical protein
VETPRYFYDAVVHRGDRWSYIADRFFGGRAAAEKARTEL